MFFRSATRVASIFVTLSAPTVANLHESGLNTAADCNASPSPDRGGWGKGPPRSAMFFPKVVPGGQTASRSHRITKIANKKNKTIAEKNDVIKLPNITRKLRKHRKCTMDQ